MIELVDSLMSVLSRAPLGMLILLFLYYFFIYCTVFWILVLLENRKKIFVDPKVKEFPRVSIVIPAFNEEKTIAKAIESCLNLNYPKDKLEVIVVNDGSTDRTREICETYAKKGLIKLINKKNEGKAKALNLGIKHASGEIIGCLDADSYYQEDALLKMIGYFKDKEVAAVTPALKTEEPKNWLEKIQHLEYLFSIYLRKLFSFLNCIYVIPGPGSLYRRDVLELVGGFDPENLVEDTDIALKIQKHGFRVENSVNAVVHTHIPRTFRGLLKQRLRWYGGYLENVLGKHRDMIFFTKSPNLGLFLIPSNFLWLFSLVYLLGFTLFENFNYTYAVMRNFFIIGDPFFLLKSFRITDFISINFLTAFFLVFLLFSLVLILISIRIGREKVKLKERYSNYLYYIALYFIFISTFWFLSSLWIIYRKVARKKGWRREKVE